MSISRSVTGFIGAVALFTSLTGCASTPAQNAANGSTSPAASSSDGVIVPGAGRADILAGIAKDPALAGKLPKEYVSKPIVVGGGFASPPMRFKGDGELIGAEADLMRATAKVLGTEVTFLQVSFDGLIPALKSKRIDALVSSMADYPDRREQIDFVDYYEGNTTILVKKGNPEKIQSIADLCGKTVALEKGVSTVARVQKQSDECVSNSKPAIQLSLFSSSNDAVLQLQTGRAVASANDYPLAAYQVLTVGNGKALEIVAKPITGGYFYGVGVRKDDQGLRDAIQAAMQKLLDDGTYGKILDSYGLKLGAMDRISVNEGKRF